MSMKKYLADRKERVDGKEATQQEVASLVNGVALKLIKDFAKQTQEEGYHMDTTDLMRVYQIWSDVNGATGAGDGSGVLPGLSGTESDDLGEHVETTVEYDSEGNEINYVSADDLVNLSHEDIERMVESREDTLNDKNEGSA